MNRSIVAGFAALAVLLSGCAADAAATPTETIYVTAPPSETPEPVAEAAPLDAKKAAPVEAADEAKALQSRWYQFFGRKLHEYGYEFPLIGEALPVGQFICDQYRAGVDPAEIVPVEGVPDELAYMNTDIVKHTLMIGYELTSTQEALGETLPDYCGVAFPPA